MNNFFEGKQELYDSCWLNYKTANSFRQYEEYKELFENIVIDCDSKIVRNVCNELIFGLEKILNIKAKIHNQSKELEKFIYLGIQNKTKILTICKNFNYKLSEEGFIIKEIKDKNIKCIMLLAESDAGLIYSIFNFLRLLEKGQIKDNIEIVESPKAKYRILNHWDNMDGSIERGYSGKSIFFNNNEINFDKERIIQYCRLIASVGINGVVINNVNVKDEETLLITKKYLPKLKELANIFRNYNIKLYLSINFASSITIGGLDTADPLDSEVVYWWKEKVNEIYSYIKDFGGFLIKADSEFREGPFTYNRNHAEGANMFAKALNKFGGIVIWRCFVYNCQQDWRDNKTDRANAAYDIYKPLDGEFLENVVLQIKNGPMDFQVREPVSPLFGKLEKTNQFLELQITQEYTGQQKHICYLGEQWNEILEFKTFADNKESKVKNIINNKVFNELRNGIVGVANIGDDNNWTGHKLAQINLYCFGRLAWDSDLTYDSILKEWINLTFGYNEKVEKNIYDIIINSWRTYEKYTSPLGIGWMINPGHHYGPNVDGYEYSFWGTYHRANNKTLGVDRTKKNGTGFTSKYFSENYEIFEDIQKCPEELLLFFHKVPYTYKLSSGETLIQHIYNSHFEGVEEVYIMKERWIEIRDFVKKDFFENVLERLNIQIKDSIEWRDVVNTYFYRISGIKDKLDRKIYI